MDINLFNNLQLNGAELKSVQKELIFEFSVQDFLVRAVEENGVAKVVHVMHQGQTYTDPAYLANWQTWTDHVFNTIKPVIEAGDKPVAPVLPVEPVKALINFDDEEDEDEKPKKKSAKKSQPEPKSKLPIIIIAVVAVLAVLAIIAAGIWWFGIREADEPENNDPGFGLEFNSPDLPIILPGDDTGAGENFEYDSGALALARSLIEFNPQSEANIIEELVRSVSGFSDEEIEWALNQIELEVDWYEQAVLMAQSLMESWESTPVELYENLIASGFTESQANHAVNVIEFE